MDISIVVPVYNVENYIVRCLDSIFSQQFSGTFEVIAIDDASTDCSLQVLQDYRSKEDRLTVIAHDTNKKLSIARTAGMKAAKGDYIMHVDSDDWLMPNALEDLFGQCKKTGADVVEFGVISKDIEGNTRSIFQIRKELLTTDKFSVRDDFFQCAVNKIVRRELTDNLVSGTVSVNTTEDLLYSFEILLRATKIYLYPRILYVYFVNTGSLTNTVRPDQYIQNQLVILDKIEQIIEKYNTPPQLIENALDYFEKWIYLMIAQMHFRHLIRNTDHTWLISGFRNKPILGEERVRKLESAMRGKYRCLMEVARRFSIRTAMGFIYRSIRHYF